MRSGRHPRRPGAGAISGATRPLHLAAGPPEHGREAGDPLRRFVRTAGRDLLAVGSPVAAEEWASHVLGASAAVRQEADEAGAHELDLEATLLELCLVDRSPEALACATALGAVAQPPHDVHATAVAAHLRGAGVNGPAWLEHVGTVRPRRAWVIDDVFGDEQVYIVAMEVPATGHQHALMVLVDHNVGGQARDASLADPVSDVAAEVAAAWESQIDPHRRLSPVPPMQAMREIRDAMASSEHRRGDTGLRTRDFAAHQALVWSWLRHLGLGDRSAQVTPGLSHPDRDRLLRAFLSSPEAAALAGTADAEVLAEHLLCWRADGEGRPLRWSPRVVALVLAQMVPPTPTLHPRRAGALLQVMEAMVRWAGRLSGLAEPFVAETLAAIGEHAPLHPPLMGHVGPRATSEGDGAARVPADVPAGVRVDVPAEVAGGLQADVPADASADASADVVAADVVAAPVLDRFAQLAGFYAGGRKVTAKGHPTLADARRLIDLLGLHDRMDKRIGDHVFKTRSAAELPQLSMTMTWAQKAGVLHRKQGRLAATPGWAQLTPRERFGRSADALLELGPRSAGLAPNEWMALLDILVDGPVPYDEALDGICGRAQPSLPIVVAGFRRNFYDRRLAQVCQLLEEAGIAARHEARRVPDRYEPGGERLEGGSIVLTPPGTWWWQARA